MEVVLRGVAANDTEATQIVHDAEEKVRIKPEMAYSAVKRAFDWHDKQASTYQRKADEFRAKGFKERLEYPKKGKEMYQGCSMEHLHNP